MSDTKQTRNRRFIALEVALEAADAALQLALEVPPPLRSIAGQLVLLRIRLNVGQDRPPCQRPGCDGAANDTEVRQQLDVMTQGHIAGRDHRARRDPLCRQCESGDDQQGSCNSDPVFDLPVL